MNMTSWQTDGFFIYTLRGSELTIVTNACRLWTCRIVSRARRSRATPSAWYLSGIGSVTRDFRKHRGDFDYRLGTTQRDSFADFEATVLNPSTPDTPAIEARWSPCCDVDGPNLARRLSPETKFVRRAI